MAGAEQSLVKLRISASQVHQTLELLDEAGEVIDGSSKRKHARCRFRLRSPMRLACARENGHVFYEASPRDISTKGMALLVGGFIHMGTACVMSVPMLDGERLRLGGTVRACKHVAGPIHEVGVEFSGPVDVGCFVEEPGAEQAPSPALLGELEQCAGRLAMLAREGAPWTDLRRAVREIQSVLGVAA